MGLPETGKAAKAIDGALEHILTYRKRLAREENERASTDWVLMYVAGLIDTMVTASTPDRVRFAREINDVIRTMGITPINEPRILTRAPDFEAPPDEGEWLIDTNIHVGED